MHLLKLYLSKQSKLFCFKHKAVLAFIFSILLINFGCGKRKPPLPPVERVQQRVEISGFQRGNKILISWKMPNRNATDSDLLNIDRADIYRFVEKADGSYSLSEEEFSARSIIISSVKINQQDFFDTKTFIDTLEFAGQPVRIRYAVRFVNKNGQKAAFSNFLTIDPVASIPTAPNNLKVSVSQENISLIWEEPQLNIDNSNSTNIVGYNVYRSEKKDSAAKLINKTPVSANEFKDIFFEFGKVYYYFVRAVSLGSNSEPVESDESNIVEIAPVDNFVPSPPDAVTIAAAPGTISIFFAINLEKDVIGYKIFRSTEANLPKDEWTQINEGLLKVNSFNDFNVESGVKYYYYLKAIDNAGNVSEPSVIVSETTP
ncbi:MAG: hypothetical protein LUM44_16580 [Pyrinomonadaceae bacterium]|nr:hypothetical protein [Pyrinomonadaceae bacterium]